MRVAFIALPLASLNIVTPTRADEIKPAEAAPLEGRWQVVALESEGRKAPMEVLAEGGWTFKGPEVIFDANPPGRASFKLDQDQAPKEVELTSLEGPQPGKSMMGIYRLVDGKLTICVRDFDSAQKGLPTEFTTTTESGLGLITLERASR